MLADGSIDEYRAMASLQSLSSFPWYFDCNRSAFGQPSIPTIKACNFQGPNGTSLRHIAHAHLAQISLEPLWDRG